MVAEGETSVIPSNPAAPREGGEASEHHRGNREAVENLYKSAHNKRQFTILVHGMTEPGLQIEQSDGGVQRTDPIGQYFLGRMKK